MLSFKSFLKESYLIEYLTDTQREKFAKVKMTPEARSSTDHFFGVGNDHVREEIKGQDEENKSEVHKKIEQHLGTQIDVNSYKKGTTKDKYGREVKIGKVIQDDKLRNEFANDSTRAGVKSSHGHYCTIVRGTEVAGQTNSAPNAEHPQGHSWGDESCKNVDNGSNKKYLKPEIKHGTVVARVHDSSGKEIYRATLQPYHNDQGHTAYKLNGEYGIKHSNFTKHAHDVANRLSGEHKGGSIAYKINPNVYDHEGSNFMFHPKTTKEHLDTAIRDKNPKVRRDVIRHPKVTKEHLDLAMKDEDPDIREAVINHPKSTKHHLDLGMKDESFRVRRSVINHPNSTKEHIDAGIKDKDVFVREAVMYHPKATQEHINLGIKDPSFTVRVAAMNHPKATKEHLDLGMKDDNPAIRAAVVKHPNATKEHIEAGLKDESPYVRDVAKKRSAAKA